MVYILGTTHRSQQSADDVLQVVQVCACSSVGALMIFPCCISSLPPAPAKMSIHAFSWMISHIAQCMGWLLAFLADDVRARPKKQLGMHFQ